MFLEPALSPPCFVRPWLCASQLSTRCVAWAQGLGWSPIAFSSWKLPVSLCTGLDGMPCPGVPTSLAAAPEQSSTSCQAYGFAS